MKKRKIKRTSGRTSKKRIKTRVLKRGSKQKPLRHYPITETLDWIAEGQILLRKWGAIKSPTARRVAGVVERLLGMVMTINEIRKM